MHLIKIHLGMIQLNLKTKQWERKGANISLIFCKDKNWHPMYMKFYFLRRFYKHVIKNFKTATRLFKEENTKGKIWFEAKLYYSETQKMNFRGFKWHHYKSFLVGIKSNQNEYAISKQDFFCIFTVEASLINKLKIIEFNFNWDLFYGIDFYLPSIPKYIWKTSQHPFSFKNW